MGGKSIQWVVWAAVAALAIVLGGLLGYQAAFTGTDRSLTANSKIGAPFTLTDDNGDTITEEAMADDPSVVFFGFTHCPEVCPTTLYELSTWFDDLGEEGKNIKAFFVSLDPERDTPEVMKSYVENFTDRIIGITGDPQKVHALAKAWHIYWRRIPLEDGGYTMDHTASIFLVDAKGKFKGTIAYGESGETAKEKLRRLAKTS